MNDKVNDMVDELEYGAIQKRKVPDFLKTIAILTFTGSFVSILVAIVMLVLTYVAAVWRPPSAGSASFVLGEQDPFVRWTIIYCVMLMVTSVICSVGAAVMLKIRPGGFWVYSLGQALHFVFLIKYIVVSAEGDSGWMFHVFHLIVCAAFLVMYVLNKKHFPGKRLRGKSGIDDIYE